MDILRKMFKNQGCNNDDENNVNTKHAFRKPQWFEETETDDDELFDDDRKFAFQMFTNPVELQKHFEQQVQKILDDMSKFEDNEGIKCEKNLKGDFLQPGFERNFLKEFEKRSNGFIDTDLDGEIYADQLHSLMQRLTGNCSDHVQQQEAQIGNILPRNDNKQNRKTPSKKISDEEAFLDQIHGTLIDEDKRDVRVSRPGMTMTPIMPRHATPFGGVFEGAYQGPKMFSQSVMTKSTRMPDGTYETTKITLDSQGNKITTITRTINGKSKTTTTYDNVSGEKPVIEQPNVSGGTSVQIYSDRNVYVSKNGYALPRNLW